MVAPETANLLRELISDIDQLQEDVNNLVGGGFSLGDDAKLLFGDDSDFSMRYNSSEDEFVFLNETTGNEIFRIDATLFNGTELILENGNILLKRDGAKLIYGVGDDISSRYDDGADDMRWRDENNSADRMAIDRTTGNLRIEGVFTEGAAL